MHHATIFKPYWKFRLWTLKSAINVSVAICKLPTCQFPAFGKRANVYPSSCLKLGVLLLCFSIFRLPPIRCSPEVIVLSFG